MGWIRGIKHEIVGIEANVELGLNCRDGIRRGWFGKYNKKEAGIWWEGLESHLKQNPFYYVVPTMGGLT